MESITDIIIATVPRGDNAQTVFTGFTQMQAPASTSEQTSVAAEETAVDLSYFIWHFCDANSSFFPSVHVCIFCINSDVFYRIMMGDKRRTRVFVERAT